MWVAMEATTLASAPLHLLQPQRPLAGSDLEVPADRLGRHRPGAARLALPGLRVAARPGWNRRCCSTTWSRHAPAAVAALAARRVRAAVRRLRHQDGPGADAHLEAGRLRRSAGHRRRRCWPAGVTSCAFLAILRFYQICQRRPARRRSPGEIMICHGPAVDGRRRRCSWSGSATSSACWPTPASSTWASWSSASASAGWPCTGALLHLINNGLTKGVLFLSAGNIHRAYGSKLTDDVRGALAARAASRARCSWPASCHHRLAAVRAVRQRVHHRQGRHLERGASRLRRSSC